VQAKSLVDRGAPTLTQAAVADFITEGHFERHLQQLRQAYGRRRAVLVDGHRSAISALGQVRYAPMAAGLHVMLYLAKGVNRKRP
jgi:GntR family transcriptional regulator / MocR family aminotransferase